MPEIRTVAELIAVALAAERNAVRAYDTLAGQLQRHGNQELARLFSRLSAEEAKHDDEIVRLATELGIASEPAAQTPMWHDPAARLVDQDDATNPATSTPYKALAYAVDNEEIAFRFFSYVAATAEDDRVRRIAEAFAREELGHAAILRAQRRRAFHEARKTEPKPGLPDPRGIHDLQDLVDAASIIQRDIAEQVAAINERDGELRVLIEHMRAEADALARESGPHKHAARRAGTEAPQMSEAPAQAGQSLHDALAELDRAFAFYDSVVQFAVDESIGNRAQALASSALEDMKVLRKIIESESAPA